MPSSGTFSLGTAAGRDYSTISGWEADTDVSLTGVVTGECYADSDFDETLAIAGASTTSSQYRHLTVADGERHTAQPGTGATLNVSSTGSSSIIQSNEQWSRVGWLEITGNGANWTSSTTNLLLMSDQDQVWHHLFLRDVSVGGSQNLAGNNTGFRRAGFQVHNNIVANLSSGGVTDGFKVRGGDLGQFASRWENNTVYNITGTTAGRGYLVDTGDGDIVLRNCGAFDCGQDFDAVDTSGAETVENNASSDGTADNFKSGTNNLVNLTTSSQFVDLTAGAEDFHLQSTADLVDAGQDLGDVLAKVDVDGKDRHAQAVVWDIGADEEELSAGQALVEFVDDVLRGAESVSFDVVTQVVQHVSESAQLAETRDRVRDLVRVAGEVLNPSEALYFLGGYFTANDVWSRTAVDGRPAAPSNLSATAVSDSRIDLSWTDNASTEDECQVYRDGSLYKTLAANTTSYSDTGLASATQYCYEVRACNEHGCSSFSNQACATTDAGVPSAPSNLSASEKLCSGSAGDVELTFTDNSDTEDSWVVYKDGALFDEVTSSTSGTTGTITITATGSLTPGESATFEVAAKNADGESAKSNSSSVTVETVPSAPSGLTASWSSQFCNVSLSWTDNASNECEFVVYRDGVEIARPAADSTSYTDPNANANTSYTYEVAAANDQGESATDSTSITTGDCNLS